MQRNACSRCCDDRAVLCEDLIDRDWIESRTLSGRLSETQGALRLHALQGFDELSGNDLKFIKAEAAIEWS